MKVTKIALATTMALAAMSAQAASTGIPATPANIVFIAGASGIDGYMSAAATSLINVTARVSSPNSIAWYGTTKAAWGTLASGSEILLIKRSAGGSAVGVMPLGAQTKTNVPVWTDGTVSGVSGTSWTTTDTTDANGLIPDVGVSDVEPAMFKGWNLEFGYTPLTSTQASGLTSNSWAVLAEGIVATKAVADSTVLSNNFIREALSGHYQDWSAADGSADPMIICRRIQGSGTQAAYNSYFQGFPGTSAYNGYANSTAATTLDSFGYGDSASGLGTKNGSSALNAIGIDPSAGFTVFEADGSGDVRKCLQAAQLHLDVALKGRDAKYYNLKFSNLTTASKAIGVLSVDSYTKTSTSTTRTVDGNGVASSNIDNTGEYTFRFLNGNGTYDVKNQAVTTVSPTVSTGVAPSRANILTGAYDFVVEPTMQYKTSAVKAFISAPTTGFYTRLITVLGNPADMETSSTNNTTPLAYAALPTLYTKTNDSASTRLVVDLTHQGNTTAPLHVKQ